MHRIRVRVSLVLFLAMLCSPVQAENPFISRRLQPIVFGGGPGPENTLAAVRRSLDLGLQFVEVDVRLTKDGRLVLMHDPSVERVAGTRGIIAEMTFAEARRLDVGSSYVEATVLKRPYAGERVATPAEVIAATHGKAAVLFDLKVPAAAEPIIRLLDQTGAFERVLFRVSDESEIARLRQIDERVQFVLSGPLPESDAKQLLERWKSLGLVAYTPDRWTEIRPEVVQRFHDAGIALFAIGANRPREMAQMADVGVDALFTESPTILRRIARAGKTSAPALPAMTPPTPIRIADVIGGHVHPALCVTASGTILVAYNKSGGAGKELLLSRSTDGGVSWSGPVSIPPTTHCPVYPGSMQTLTDGRVLLTWTCYRDGDLQGPQLFSLSRDEGQTWSEPKSLGTVGFLRHPILELSNNAWLFPLRDQTAVYNPSRETLTPLGDGRNHGRVPIVRTRKGTLISGAIPGGFRSTDEGATWQPIQDFPRFRVAGYDLTLLANDWIVLTMILYQRDRERSYQLVVSRDDGATWDYSSCVEIYNPGRPISGRGWPRTVQLDEETLGTVFYDLDESQPRGKGLFFVRTPISRFRRSGNSS